MGDPGQGGTVLGRSGPGGLSHGGVSGKTVGASEPRTTLPHHQPWLGVTPGGGRRLQASVPRPPMLRAQHTLLTQRASPPTQHPTRG